MTVLCAVAAPRWRGVRDLFWAGAPATQAPVPEVQLRGGSVVQAVQAGWEREEFDLDLLTVLRDDPDLVLDLVSGKPQVQIIMTQAWVGSVNATRDLVRSSQRASPSWELHLVLDGRRPTRSLKTIEAHHVEHAAVFRQPSRQARGLDHTRT